MIIKFLKEHESTLICVLVTVLSSFITLFRNQKLNETIWNVILIFFVFVCESFHFCKITVTFKNLNYKYNDIVEIPLELTKEKTNQLEIKVYIKYFHEFIDKFIKKHYLIICLPKGVSVTPNNKGLFDFIKDNNSIKIPLAYLGNEETILKFALSPDEKHKYGFKKHIECKTNFFNKKWHLKIKNKILIKWDD